MGQNLFKSSNDGIEHAHSYKYTLFELNVGKMDALDEPTPVDRRDSWDALLNDGCEVGMDQNIDMGLVMNNNSSHTEMMNWNPDWRVRGPGTCNFSDVVVSSHLTTNARVDSSSTAHANEATLGLSRPSYFHDMLPNQSMTSTGLSSTSHPSSISLEDAYSIRRDLESEVPELELFLFRDLGVKIGEESKLEESNPTTSHAPIEHRDTTNIAIDKSGCVNDVGIARECARSKPIAESQDI